MLAPAAAPLRALGVGVSQRHGPAACRLLVCVAPCGSRPRTAHVAAAPGRLHSRAASSSTHTAASQSAHVLAIAPKLQLPVFSAPASAVRVLDSPHAFHAELLQLIGDAHEHVVLASLYLGPGEAQVIAALREALRRRPHLRCTVLLDYQRATREGPYVAGTAATHSSASLLAPLARDFPAQCEVRLFRTPGLPAWAERMLGKRLVEGWGLQHMKCYGHERTTLWSGANLSRDYFTNRQDRYMTIASRALSAYARALLLLIARHSYLLRSPNAPHAVPGPLAPPPQQATPEEHGAYTLEWDGGAQALLEEGPEGTIQQRASDGASHPALPERGWRRNLGREVAALTARWTALSRRAEPAPDAVRITPLLQMGALGVAQETRAAPLLQPALDSDARLALTSGYFGLSRPWAQLVLRSQAPTLIMAAAPRANGFFGSKGISRHLPPAYTWLEQRFWIALGRRGRRGTDDDRGVRMMEWEREGWTYHAKGIWLVPAAGQAPQHTLIGSSNLGRRSARRDLEASLLLSLPDAAASKGSDDAELTTLRRALDDELKGLRAHATQPVDDALFARKERYVHPGVRVAAWCIQSLL